MSKLWDEKPEITIISHGMTFVNPDFEIWLEKLKLEYDELSYKAWKYDELDR